MKKILFSMLMTFAALLDADAHAVSHAEMKLKEIEAGQKEISLRKKPAYLSGAIIPSWKDNWFVSVSGGTSSFIGSPLGCDDLFGRIRPALQISLGKWHTPSVGNRLVFQGFEWKSGALTGQQYRHYHADLLLNLMPSLAMDDEECRWNIIPFVGVGMIDNRDADSNPFAFNYGVQGRFRLADCLHITAEIGNATTFKNADGFGPAREVGDHLLTLSAGVSWTFGKNRGWKKVLDARPYIIHNERLEALAYAQERENERLAKENEANLRLIAELRKILEIEGLLDRYAGYFDRTDDNGSVSAGGYAMNDYSGLNSLRKRLREGKNGNSERDNRSEKETAGNSNGGKTGDTCDGDWNDYRNDVINGNAALGAPIYFFFELGTANLVEESQLVNIDEIARVAKKYGLGIEITGAADKATGTEMTNSNLGSLRASFIAGCLKEKGIKEEMIKTFSKGGIDDYTPGKANRNATVRLFLPCHDINKQP
ncbi:OmpA family protein [Bacteroides uniformis]|uniref:OmpA family protein n=1 Tax=Bacteroides uniformis TaxID=820 RepID=UPI0039B37D71